jgi:nucleotide-binding universal stress UspA family protein
MRTLLRRSSHDDLSGISSADGPVLLATLDVPFSGDAIAFAIDAAVENGRPLLVVNVAAVLLTPATLVGYGYIERDDLQAELAKPAELARSMAVRVERLRVCSPHPVDALLHVVEARKPAVVVFGPDRSHLRRRAYARARRQLSRRVTCLFWAPEGD